ncbi:unnamed protein product [Phytomonas sp. Hart1]|nr:unnamed protein product [Phytomonas sp. Hart1]|eukprot:CCW72143.1 unnamed protein product [Phytomonas sp. isolate Hart1]
MSSPNSSQHDGKNVEREENEVEWEGTKDSSSPAQNSEQVVNRFESSIPTDASPTPYSEQDVDNYEQISSDNDVGDYKRVKGSLYDEEYNTEIQAEPPEPPDNVGYEVRQYGPGEPAPSSKSDYAVLDNAQAAFSPYHASDLRESPKYPFQNAEPFTFPLQNPSQGVQAENVSSSEPATLDDLNMIKREKIEASTPANPKSFNESAPQIDDGLSMKSLSILRSLSTTITTVNKGFVDITFTFYPMGFQTRLTHPCYNINAFSAEGATILSEYNVISSSSSERKEWVLIARDLFEMIARHICMHPQSFVLYYQDKRVRFNSLMFLERERGRSAPREDPSIGPSSGIENSVNGMRTEPLWLSVAFSNIARTMPTSVIDSNFIFSDNHFASDGALDESQDAHPLSLTPSLANVPRHLASITKGEFLSKCILVRKKKIAIAPEALVKGRRAGFTFDEVIQRLQRQDPPVAGDAALWTAVSILRDPAPRPKAFLGGYTVHPPPIRLLLHASTQAFMAGLDYSPHGGAKRAGRILADLRSRQTQTYGKSRGTQTRREGCAQTPRPDLLLDRAHDVLVRARPYFTAAALRALRVAKAILLQKMYRQWKARQVCRALYEAETERQLRMAARQRVEEAAVRARAEIERHRRLNPHRANDFGVLKEELLQWRSHKAKSITQDGALSAEQKRAALLALTKEEVKLLQDLELHRKSVRQNQQGQRLVRVLEKAASAKQWGGISVTTPGTLRAAELRDLFYNLTSNDFDVSSRMDILLHIKWTVKEFPDSSESKELCQLIDREADLINRGWKSASLVELRKRITNIFRNFILDPEYNPEMIRYNDSSIARRKAETLGRDKITPG